MNDAVNQVVSETTESGKEVPGENQNGIVTALAELPLNAHLDAEALGRILGRCKKTIQRAVRRGELPPPIKFMGRHVWLVKTILEHMESRQETALRQFRKRLEKISRDSI